MIQDPTFNQHKRMIFVVIIKQIKSLSIFSSKYILETHNYNSDLIAIMTSQKGVGITPASMTFRLPIQSFK